MRTPTPTRIPTPTCPVAPPRHTIQPRPDRARTGSGCDQARAPRSVATGVPAQLAACLAGLAPARGDRARLYELFTSSLVPLIAVDSDRRCMDVNLAARLLLRRPLSAMRGARLDDMTAPERLDALHSTWDSFMQRRSVRGTLSFAGLDGGSLTVSCAAVANVLPGLHLLAIAPAGWPAREMPVIHVEDSASADVRLTARQRTIMELVARGQTAADIGRELMLSENTVRTHLRHALYRLGARNRAQGVAMALAAGLIDPKA